MLTMVRPASTLEFASHAPQGSREDVEQLLYFNPHQHLVREGILDSLSSFGQPHIITSRFGLTVRVGNEETQTLFAFDRRYSSTAPIGLVVFIRTSQSDIVIIHLAIHSNYVLPAGRVSLGLGVTLVEKVRDVAARIVGVSQLKFSYRRQMTLRVTPVAAPANASAASQR